VEDEEKRLEEEMREKELYDAHYQQLEEMRPGAIEKVDHVEDMLEKVDIAAAPLQIEFADSADDMRATMLEAIRETELMARSATQSIGEARRHISSKSSVVSTFVGSVKTQAVEEFTELQNKLSEATNKLANYKTVRQDYEQRVQAKKFEEDGQQVGGCGDRGREGSNDDVIARSGQRGRYQRDRGGS